MKICICCKQPVEDALAVQTENGVVHTGYCLQLVTERLISEDANGEEQEQLVEQTMLLM